jgi:hypothetical protein
MTKVNAFGFLSQQIIQSTKQSPELRFQPGHWFCPVQDEEWHTLTPASLRGGKNSIETKGLLPASFFWIKSMILGFASLQLMLMNFSKYFPF